MSYHLTKYQLFEFVYLMLILIALVVLVALVILIALVIIIALIVIIVIHSLFITISTPAENHIIILRRSCITVQ